MFWFLVKMIKHKNGFTYLILSWNVYHKFIYQCKMIKLFLGIFTRLKRIFRNIFNCFSDPVSNPELCWQTMPVDRAVDRRAQTCARLLAQWAGRPGGRPDQRALLSVSGRSTERSTGAKKSALCIWAVGRAVDRVAPTVTFLTVGGRPAGRPLGLSGCQISLTANFLFGLYKPHFFGILAKIF